MAGSYFSVTLDGRYFSVGADADVSRILGGLQGEILVFGDGNAINKLSRVPWKYTGFPLLCDDTKGDHEFLQELASRSSGFPITATGADGVTYEGNGFIVDELAQSNSSGTASVNLAGGKKLTKQ